MTDEGASPTSCAALPGRARCSTGWALLFCLPLQTSCPDAAVKGGPAPRSPSPDEAARAPDVPYEPSPALVVASMLELAAVTEEDVVYDLGCGDGRVVIAAAKERGARGVCVDIDPERIRESRDNARRAGVEERITFVTRDLFEVDVGPATVVMLFLWPKVNLRLRPKLLRELAPGTRVVSHFHAMGDWAPEQVVHVRANGRSRPVYLWRVGSSAPPRH